MPLSHVLGTISRYTRLSSRYADSLNSSQRYLNKARAVHLKPTIRPFYQRFGVLDCSSDRNLKVNIDRNHIYGRIATTHVNKTRNTASEQGQTAMNSAQKDNDDISLPFWIFLWSFLAVIAGFVYSKLNRQREIESEPKSVGNHSTNNDEQIARKLVNEISRKDSVRKPTFRRQRSYEIIDGEVCIHYDVSMLEDSLNKRTNIGILKAAEVESIPIRSTSLEDLEYVYPGKLPRIVEEGEDELVEGESEEKESSPNVYINQNSEDSKINLHDDKGEDTRMNIAQVNDILKFEENTGNLEANGLHFEGKPSDFPTNSETITQETIIPAESINDAKRIPHTNNSTELSHQNKADLKNSKNEMNLNKASECEEFSSTSKENVIENVSAMSSANSLHNSDSTSVYKLTQVEKTQGHKFTVTRREITKLKSSGEKSPKGRSFEVETSFPFVQTRRSKGTGDIDDNISQLSRDLGDDTLVSQGDMQMRQSGLNLEHDIAVSDSLLLEKKEDIESAETGAKNNEIIQANLHQICYSEVFDNEQLGVGDEYPKHGLVREKPSNDFNKLVNDTLSKTDVNELSDSSLLEHDVSARVKESNNVLVDNSGDVLLEVESHEQNNVGELALDENENCESFCGKNELAKNWKSLPVKEEVHCVRHNESDSNSSDTGDINVENSPVHDLGHMGHPGVLQDGYMGNDKFEQENSSITGEPPQMQNADELAFSKDIKDAHLLSFENRIGTRKAIFVKDSTMSRKEEPCDTISSDITVARGVEDVTSFGQKQHEDTKPDTMEFEISDEVIIAEPVQTHEVEAGCPPPVSADTIPDDPVPFARASVIEEDVLMAKIITIQEPEAAVMDVELSSFDKEQSYPTVLTDSDTSERKSTTEDCVITLKTENNTLESIQISSEQTCIAEKNTDIPNTQDIVVYSNGIGGDSKGNSKTTTTYTSKHTVTEITNTKVLSMVQKFEEAKKPKTFDQTEIGGADSGDDIRETIVMEESSEKTEEDVAEDVNQSVHGSTSNYSDENSDFFLKNIPEDPELPVHGQISKPAAVTTIITDNSVVDDSRVPIPASIVETEQIALPTELVEKIPENTKVINHACNISELEETSGNRSRDSLEEVELESDSDVKNSGDMVEEPEEIVIYADQVTEVYACDESQTIGETVEPIQARPVTDCGVTVVYAGEVIESENTAETKSKESAMDDCRTTVVYATTVIDDNQVNGTEDDPSLTVETTNTAHPVIEDEEQISTQESAEVDISSHEPISTQLNKESSSFRETCFDVAPLISSPTTISSPSEEQENAVCDAKIPFSSGFNPLINKSSDEEDILNFNKISENYNPDSNQSPLDTQEEITSSENLPTFSSPIAETKGSPSELEDSPSQPQHFPSELKESPLEPNESPLEPNESPPEPNEGPSETRESPSKAKESPPKPKESPFMPKENASEIWQNLPRGETDVDSFSDIDEIDINILPDENYQKSKSVTDLDEALASFGGLDYLSSDALGQDNMSGGLSKSVPDILDSCREETLRESTANPIEKLKKKNLSLSTPEINSKPGSKKVTKIKIVHVKFLEMQSDSENVEEDSFIYEGDMPITGKMKRRSRNLSNEFSSPVASPPPDLNKEVAQERWIAGKTNLKQLEFEFEDLFLNSPSPPPLEATGLDTKDVSSINESIQVLEGHSDTSKNTTKFQDSSMVCAAVPENSSYQTTDQVSITRKTSSASEDPILPDSSTQRPSSTEVQSRSLTGINKTTISATNTSKYEELNQRTVTRESLFSTATDFNTTLPHSNAQISKDTKLDTAKHAIPKPAVETKVTSSTEKLYQTSNTVRSSTTTSRNITSYKNIAKNNQSPKPEIVFRSPTNTDSRSYRYIPGNTQSYSKAPKPVPEEGKYVVKSGIVTTQSTTIQSNARKITTQARYTESPNSPLHITTPARFTASPNSSSPTSSPRRGLRLAEKFHMSDDGNLTQRLAGSRDQIDGPISTTNRADGRAVSDSRNDDMKTGKPDHRGSSTKGTSRPSGRLVTVKSGIISDYECSSDADSEMSYNVPSPRVKAKRYYRPQVHRVDSASSSEPDSPRRQKKDDRRSMSELFGVDKEYLCCSDTSKDGFGKESGSQNSLREPKLFARFGELPPHEEIVKRQNETLVENNQNPPYIYQARATIFDPRPIEQGKKNKIRRTSENMAERNTAPPYVPPAKTATFRSVNQVNTVERNLPKISQGRVTRYDATGHQVRRPQQSNVLERNPNQPGVYQARTATFNQRSTESRTSIPCSTSALERNLSPTNFLQEGNLGYDDEISRTMEFNPFVETADHDGFQPLERCHSPSSVYSDTSSVFSFNCDFDPMPPPTGKFEPEVYTCENPMCKKKDILLGPEKTSFKSCPACFTYYCSSECRKLHWPSHKQSCYFGRVNTYVRSIIRLCQRREDLSMYLSQLARDGYKKKGRGVVMAIFNNPELAREFITKGHDAFSGRKPTYSSLAELHREGIISKHRVALMQAVRDYEPNQEFVFNIAVVATNNIPITPAPRYKLNTVLHCIKMPLNDVIVARQPKDFDKVETRLFALPKCSRHEFVNEMEARRHYCRNLSKNLRQYNIKLKDNYPECYRKLCLYVEHNISFEPMTVYGQRSGLSYKCVIAPEQSYPLTAEYC